MVPIIALLAALVIVGTILWLFDLRDRKRHPVEAAQEDAKPIPRADAACTDDSCSLREVCPSQMLLDGMMRGEVTYYDDQELDDFKGRQATDYTDDEIDQWRDVLYTLQPQDLMGWEQSIKRRGLIMPQPVHDEFIMLYGEQLGRKPQAHQQAGPQSKQ